MTRTSILSFVDSRVERELNMRITMDIDLPKKVLSKYYAYRGLMLSSCHCLDGWYPKIVIVPDYYRTVSDQRIKYAYDKETEFVDKDGNKRRWVQKDIAETHKDITINVFDGSGIHHPNISKTAKEMIGSDTDLTSILWRAPYIKGVTNEMDYETFFAERGITKIKDVWGHEHDFSEPMIIMTESMYKGMKYFKVNGDYSDWEEYWRRFRKYDHCLGIAKWNFSLDEEPLYTRGNYQIFQDLELPYEEFATIAKDSIDWIKKIIDGDRLYTYCFLGLVADKPNAAMNDYAKAIMKNPEILKESSVRNYLIYLIKKYKDEMKCGKLWLRSSFKFLVVDPIMLMEHIGGLEPNGCLGEDEFYSFDSTGVMRGERLIERNPHICKSEHVILNAVNNEQLRGYCSHLANTCIINGKSITPQQLNGADFDGDLVLVVDNPVMMRGVDRSAATVIDIEDKITAMEEEDTKDNFANFILRTMNSLIGETSNCATTYHNKSPKSKEQKLKYESYIDLLSVINGKAIDAAKTGVIYNIPRNIAKYAKPQPYFMKYAGEYYSKLKKFLHSNSNMNKLCKEIERWEKPIRFKRTYKDFDYSIMIDKSIVIPDDILFTIEDIYLRFCDEMKQLGKEQNMINNYDKYKDELDGVITKSDAKHFVMNWNHYYNKYKNECVKACPNKKMLANVAVLLSYKMHPDKNKKFIWRVASEGILENIEQVSFEIPVLDKNGKYEYLGRKYNFSLPVETKEGKDDVVD